MFSFDLRNAYLAEQHAAAAEPSQNVYGTWFVGDRYFANEADARLWKKVEMEKAAERAAMQARVEARRAHEEHVAMMARVEPTIRSLDAWCKLIEARLHLEAIVEDLERQAELLRRLPQNPSRREIEDAGR